MVLVHGMCGANDDQRSIRTIHHAIDARATMIGTADAYGLDGHNDRLIGEAIARRRGEVQIATKWGIVVEDSEHAHRVAASYANEIWVDARPERG